MIQSDTFDQNSPTPGDTQQNHIERNLLELNIWFLRGLAPVTSNAIEHDDEEVIASTDRSGAHRESTDESGVSLWAIFFDYFGEMWFSVLLFGR